MKNIISLFALASLLCGASVSANAQNAMLPDRELLARALGGFNHLVALGEVERHGLFAQDMDTVLERSDGGLGVGDVRRADAHGVHSAVKQLFHGRIGDTAKFLDHRLSTFREIVIEGNQFTIGIFCIFRRMVSMVISGASSFRFTTRLLTESTPLAWSLALEGFKYRPSLSISTSISNVP